MGGLSATEVMMGAGQAMANASDWLAEANLLIEHGANPAHAVGLGLYALEEGVKAFAWANSLVVETAKQDELRNLVVGNKHKVRLLFGSLIIALGQVGPTLHRKYQKQAKAMAEIFAAKGIEYWEEDIREQGGAGIAAEAGLPHPIELGREMIDEMVKPLRDQGILVEELDIKQTSQYLRRLRESAIYVDWDANQELRSIPRESIDNEEATQLLVAIRAGLDVVARVVTALRRANDEGQLPSIQRLNEAASQFREGS